MNDAAPAPDQPAPDQPGSNERLLAALAHAGIITNGFNLLGLLAATLIWLTQREHSPFVRRHAWQALLFQGMVVLLGLLLGVAWAGCLLISLLPAILQPALYRTDLPPTFWMAMLLGLGLLGLLLGLTVYGLVAAWAAWQGKPFHYALLGKLSDLPARLAKPAAPADNEPPSAA